MMTTTKKNPAAVALGRLGGTASTPAQRAARRRNGKLGGRPPRPRLTRRELASHLRALLESSGLDERTEVRVRQILTDLPHVVLVP